MSKTAGVPCCHRELIHQGNRRNLRVRRTGQFPAFPLRGMQTAKRFGGGTIEIEQTPGKIFGEHGTQLHFQP